MPYRPHGHLPHLLLPADTSHNVVVDTDLGGIVCVPAVDDTSDDQDLARAIQVGG